MKDEDHDRFDAVTLLKMSQVSAMVGRHPSTVRRWMSQGMFPPPQPTVPGAPDTWTLKQLKDWLANRRRARRVRLKPRGMFRHSKEAGDASS